MQKLLNAILFQITWFACVLGAANQLIWPGIICCTGFAIWQPQAKRRHSSDLTIVWYSIIAGLIIDSSWIKLGFFNYQSPWPHVAIAPIWIIALWLSFALSINHSLSWLKSHPILPTTMGLIGAPLSYWAGHKLGALEFITPPAYSLSCLGIVWAITLSFLFYKSRLPTATKP